MDIQRESSKDFQFPSYRVPVTKSQPICAERQENWLERERFSERNQLGEANWLESESSSTGFSHVGCCDSMNSGNLNIGFYDWESAVGPKSLVSGDNVDVYDKLSLDRRNNIVFAHLLALARAATTIGTTASANETQQGNIDAAAASEPHISVFDSHIEGKWVESTSANQCLPLGSNLRNSNCVQDTPQ